MIKQLGAIVIFSLGILTKEYVVTSMALLTLITIALIEMKGGNK